ncbi:MAG: glycosyltransferase family 4 protein [Cyanobacteria bacterium RM1_2_2]|nr:glycosyltransferase family 4 protein [Cyanobacteria bacterium RM1_2_2]
MNRQNEAKRLPKVVMLGPELKQMGGIATVENLILANMPSDVEIHHIPTHNDGSVSLRVRLFANAVWQSIWKFSTEDVDAVHIFLSQRGSAVRNAILTVIARAYRKPVIIHAQSSEFHVFYDNLSAVGQLLLRSIFCQCAYFIALSESWKRYYTQSLKLNDSQAVVLPNPVQLPAHVPDRSSSENATFLFLGRIGQRKGAFDLIQAFAALPDEQKAQAHLFIAGDGEVAKARSMVQELNLGQCVTILDWLNPEQRDIYLAKADVFVLPTNNEGLPLALLEAMGWGLPGITTPVGGIPELVTSGQDGILVEPGNVEQLSEAIKSLIDDKDLRLTLGKNARAKVEPLNIHSYCATLVALYRSASHQSAPEKVAAPEKIAAKN